MARAPVSKFGLGHPGPFYLVALSQCFRSEVSRAGRLHTPSCYAVPPSWVAKWVAEPEVAAP